MNTETKPTHSLYHTPLCGYCMLVKRTITKLDIDVEMRNLWDAPEHAQDLREATGRNTVPVLRIDGEEGSQWMSESADIIRYLNENHA
ncbi:MAG: glutaredoxin family protein [Arenicellales bacterium WSBS_2016_MAG_OTU3]